MNTEKKYRNYTDEPSQFLSSREGGTAKEVNRKVGGSTKGVGRTDEE